MDVHQPGRLCHAGAGVQQVGGHGRYELGIGAPQAGECAQVLVKIFPAGHNLLAQLGEHHVVRPQHSRPGIDAPGVPPLGHADQIRLAGIGAVVQAVAADDLVSPADAVILFPGAEQLPFSKLAVLAGVDENHQCVLVIADEHRVGKGGKIVRAFTEELLVVP